MNTKLIRAAFLVACTMMQIPGCSVYRDDTTGVTRQLVADQLGVDYDAVKPSSTLKDLGCDDLDVVEIIMTLEESFGITIPDSEFEGLNGQDGWNDITILELANLARSKRTF